MLVGAQSKDEDTKVLGQAEMIATRMWESRIARDTLTTTGLGVIGRSANLLIPFVVGGLFGVSADTDAVFLALGILVLFTGVFAWAVEAVVVPFIAKLRAKGEAKVAAFVGAVLLWSALGVLASCIVLLVLARPLLALLTSLSVDTINLTYVLLLELSPVLLLVMFSSVLSGTLNAYRIFWAPAVSSTLAVVVVIGAICLGKGGIGIHAVALGYVIGEVCRLLFLWSVLRKTGMGSIRLAPEGRQTQLEFLKLCSYTIVSMVVAGLPPLINRMIASYGGPGSVSIVEYAEKMFYVPAGLLGSGFLTVVLAHWSLNFQEAGVEKLRDDVYLTARVLASGALMASVVLYALRYPLVSLALGWGSIPKESLVQVARLYGVYLLGLLPNAIGLVFGRAHLVLRNTRVLLETALVGVGVLLLLNAWLAPRFGLTGIALATAGCHTAYAVYLFWMLEKALRPRLVTQHCGTNTK